MPPAGVVVAERQPRREREARCLEESHGHGRHETEHPLLAGLPLVGDVGAAAGRRERAILAAEVGSQRPVEVLRQQAAVVAGLIFLSAHIVLCQVSGDNRGERG